MMGQPYRHGYGPISRRSVQINQANREFGIYQKIAYSSQLLEGKLFSKDITTDRAQIDVCHSKHEQHPCIRGIRESYTSIEAKVLTDATAELRNPQYLERRLRMLVIVVR